MIGTEDCHVMHVLESVGNLSTTHIFSISSVHTGDLPACLTLMFAQAAMRVRNVKYYLVT